MITCIRKIKYMGKILPIYFFATIIFLSCSKKVFFAKNAYCKELDKIVHDDQFQRNQQSVIDNKYGLRTNATVIDSLNKIKSDDGSAFKNIKPISKQLEKLNDSDKANYHRENDSLWKVIRATDSINLVKIIKIVKTHGFPTFSKSKANNCSQGYGVIFRHFDYNSENGKKLIKLIKAEHKKEPLTDDELRGLIWHANGRKEIEWKIDIKKWMAQ